MLPDPPQMMQRTVGTHAAVTTKAMSSVTKPIYIGMATRDISGLGLLMSQVYLRP